MKAPQWVIRWALKHATIHQLVNAYTATIPDRYAGTGSPIDLVVVPRRTMKAQVSVGGNMSYLILDPGDTISVSIDNPKRRAGLNFFLPPYSVDQDAG